MFLRLQDKNTQTDTQQEKDTRSQGRDNQKCLKFIFKNCPLLLYIFFPQNISIISILSIKIIHHYNSIILFLLLYGDSVFNILRYEREFSYKFQIWQKFNFSAFPPSHSFSIDTNVP